MHFGMDSWQTLKSHSPIAHVASGVCSQRSAMKRNISDVFADGVAGMLAILDEHSYE